jgi:CubicO group peptidase (beta-lactamase class C family)
MAALGAGSLRAAEPAAPLSPAAIAAAASYSAKRKGAGLLIKQRGKVVHSSGTPGEARRIYSGTKAFWGLAALAAVEDEIIDLDEPVAETLHEWRDIRGKKDISIGQLLHFTGGLERGLKIHEDGLSDRNAMALARPLVATPGKSFIYGPSQLQVFHEVLKRRLNQRRRKESPTRYLERRVLRPMGLGSQRYLPDAQGNPLLAAGFIMTAAHWSRMGDLVLANGAPVLKKPSFEHITGGSNANSMYAFGFWNNHAADSSRSWEVDVEDMLERDWFRQSWSRACLCRSAPPDLLACIGSSGNRLFVIPSRDLIIVRQGQGGPFSDAHFLNLLLG